MFFLKDEKFCCFQDERYRSTQGQLDALQAEHSKAQRQLEDYAQQIQQLKDQNALLKATKGNTDANSQVLLEQSSNWMGLISFAYSLLIQKKNQKIDSQLHMINSQSPVTS